MKFRKKPVVIEAVQYTGNNITEVEKFVGKFVSFQQNCTDDGGSHFSMVIETLEGNMKAIPKDWIIKGVKGEFYPCKPDIFEATYEAVE